MKYVNINNINNIDRNFKEKVGQTKNLVVLDNSMNPCFHWQ